VTRPLALVALLLLTACSPKMEEAVAGPVVVEEESVFVEPEVPAGLGDPACSPGDDDGIGGTGCPVN
jgi:hypothetical protein